jgi:hypothetical protein
VTARFLGELVGAQISSDKHGEKFDTDFAVSLAVAFLSDRGIDVYFDALSDVHGATAEVKIARRERPLLQTVSSSRVKLSSDFKRRIPSDNAGRAETVMGNEVEAFGQALLDRIKKRLGEHAPAAAAQSAPQKGGAHESRLLQNGEKSCTGRELADALRKVHLSPEEAKAWHEDLMRAREMLIPPVDKWR